MLTLIAAEGFNNKSMDKNIAFLQKKKILLKTEQFTRRFQKKLKPNVRELYNRVTREQANQGM